MSATDQTEWERMNKVFADAGVLAELARLRMEQKEGDYIAALKWAVAMVEMYSEKPAAQ